ncbi:class I SAM-dependent methyltransferase [Alistipes sp.]|uniref:class I SAM-dependent methyltransferase n=1 Tax=Alistipes sp. TaxID=1872444 RepID=UPI003AEF770C
MGNKPSNKFGWSDENAPFYQKYLLPAFEEYLPDPAPDTALLDVGCGNGYFANYLISKGYDAYGVDIAEDGILIANRKNPGHFFVNDVETDSLPAPLRMASVKIVVSMEVIEHLYHPRAFVEHVRRILAANGGGIFILSTPYHGYIKNFFISIIGKWDYHWSVLWEGGHIKFWSERTMTRLLTEAGFRKVEIRGVGRFPYLWRHMVIRAEL